MFHVLDPRQFDKPLLDELCALSTSIRKVAKTPEGAVELAQLLKTKRAMLYFTQPSTRTFLSFSAACHILGIRFSEIRDPSTSSELKGESFEDSIQTFSSYVDVIIMRTLGEGLAEHSAALMDRINRSVPIINAGSGKDQHPTQALLDIYTLERSFEESGGLKNKVIGFLGDLKRGRTVRSLAYLMKNYQGIELVFIAPDSFQIRSDITDHLQEHDIPYQITNELDDALPSLDALYVTRLQKEYDVGIESNDYESDRYSVQPRHLARLKPSSVILHPLPRGPELHPDIDHDPRAMYWRQERNGMWMRAALLVKLFQKQDLFL